MFPENVKFILKAVIAPPPAQELAQHWLCVNPLFLVREMLVLVTASFHAWKEQLDSSTYMCRLQKKCIVVTIAGVNEFSMSSCLIRLSPFMNNTRTTSKNWPRGRCIIL